MELQYEGPHPQSQAGVISPLRPFFSPSGLLPKPPIPWAIPRWASPPIIPLCDLQGLISLHSNSASSVSPQPSLPQSPGQSAELPPHALEPPPWLELLQSLQQLTNLIVPWRAKQISKYGVFYHSWCHCELGLVSWEKGDMQVNWRVKLKILWYWIWLKCEPMCFMLKC